MIELYLGDNSKESLKLKSNINASVGTVGRFNTDPSIDLDIVSLARLVYPLNMLSSGSNTTKADKAVAEANGLYFGKNFKPENFIELVKQNPAALLHVNSDLTEIEKKYAAVIKKRKPLPINNAAIQRYIDTKVFQRGALIEKWQPYFNADIGQKTDEIRQELATRYDIDPAKISKESIAVAEISVESKAELLEIVDIFNIQQEISNTEKLMGRPEYTYSFIPFGSVSGRSTTFSGNIHGMTKEQFGIFSKKHDGQRLVSIDFSQIELRLAASLWGDFAMQDVFNRGGDIHKNTARLVGSRDRELAKAINFGLLYGMGLNSFIIYCAKDFGIILTSEEAQKYISEFKRSYPSLFDSKMTEFTGISYQTKTFGREMHAQEVWAGVYDFKKYTTSRNIQIQGEGADILKSSTIWMDQRLKGIGSVAFEMYDETAFWIDDTRDIEVHLNSICDELTQYIEEMSGFRIPVKISNRF